MKLTRIDKHDLARNVQETVAAHIDAGHDLNFFGFWLEREKNENGDIDHISWAWELSSLKIDQLIAMILLQGVRENTLSYEDLAGMFSWVISQHIKELAEYEDTAEIKTETE